MSASNNFIKIALAVMVVLNLIVISALFFSQKRHSKGGPPHHGQKGRIEAVLKEKVYFTDDQLIAFRGLKNEHREGAEQLKQRVHEARRELFKGVAAGNEQEASQLATDIGLAQAELEELTFKHFYDIRTLCTEEQLPAFESLLEDITRMLGPPPPPRH